MKKKMLAILLAVAMPVTFCAAADCEKRSNAKQSPKGHDLKETDVPAKNGPKILSSPMLYLIFFGSGEDAETQKNVEQITSQLTKILLSPYLSGLKEYGIKAPPTELAYTILPGSPPPMEKTQGRVAWLLKASAQKDKEMPSPSSKSNLLYVIVSLNETGSSGWHGFLKAQHAHYAWVPWQGEQGPKDFTVRLSHELVEAITDPERYSGVWFRSGKGGTEIADGYVGVMDSKIDDIPVSPYYSECNCGAVCPGCTPTAKTLTSPTPGCPASVGADSPTPQ